MAPIPPRTAGVRVLRHGERYPVRTAYRAHGSRIEVPAPWLVMGRTG